MTAPRSMQKSSGHAFTLLELIVVVALVAVLLVLAAPTSGRVQMRGAQARALSDARSLGLTMRLYADDNDGRYPDEQLTAGKRNGKVVTNANQAFAQLIPTYLQTEMPFYMPRSKWTPNAPDNVLDPAVADTRTETLKKGENAWALMTGLTPRSDPRWPLIIEGTNGIDTAFSPDQRAYGGVWKGAAAIIVFNDISGKIVKLDPADHKAKVSPSGADMLVYSEADHWLTATSALVNPDR